jgi:capsular polysaccharide biosynthesis protein
MSEQAVWRVKRVTWAIPVPTLAALRAAARMVGPPLLIGILAAVLATQLQPRLWRGQAEVYFNVPNLAIAVTSPTSLATSWPVNGATLYLEAQAKIARSPALAERVVQVAGVPGISAMKFLRHSSAKPESDADILRLSVTYRSGAAAVRLANAYATEFRRYKHELDMRSVTEALRKIEARIKELRARGQAGSATQSDLLVMRAELKSLGVQLRSQMTVQAADRASSFRPHALRNGLLGGVLGVLLGVAVAVGIARRRA